MVAKAMETRTHLPYKTANLLSKLKQTKTFYKKILSYIRPDIQQTSRFVDFQMIDL